MRRADREVTDLNEIRNIIDKCAVCRIALCDGNIPYIVPMNYGYTLIDGKLTLYFHGAKRGRKLDVIAKNSNACFEMDCGHNLVEADIACRYTMEFESVVGVGEIKIIEDDDLEKKAAALDIIMRKYSDRTDFEYQSPVLQGITCFVLEATEFSAKRLIKK